MARSARYIDANGFLLIKGCPVSCPGIFDYSAMQVGETEEDNHGALDRIVKVFRPQAAVSDPQFIESLKNVPLIDDHEYMIGDESVLDDTERGQIAAPEEKGVDGVMTDEVYFDAPWLRADIKVFSRRMQKALNAGKADLSLGYISHFEYKPGVHEGMAYEYVQTNMRGNHVALVQQGRVPGARVLDGLVFDSMTFDVPSPSTNNPESKMDETLMQRLSVLLPKLEAMCGGGEAAAADPAAAAAPAADPAVADPAVADPAVAEVAEVTDVNPAAGVETPAEAGGEIAVLLKRLEALVAAAGGEAAPAAEAETTEVEAGDEGGEGETETADSEHTVVVDNDETDPNVIETGDNVDGLREANSDPKLTVDTAEVPNASKGPKKGTNTEMPVGDAAFRSVMKMAADRDQLARKASKHIGTFDSAGMTPGEVAEYACKKLGMSYKGAAARVALDAYLLGASKSAPKASTAVKTGDSASTLSTGMQAYLSGSAN